MGHQHSSGAHGVHGCYSLLLSQTLGVYSRNVMIRLIADEILQNELLVCVCLYTHTGVLFISLKPSLH